MLAQFLLLAASLGATIEEIDSLAVWIECTPQELQFGDVVFVRISVRNTATKPTVVPSQFPRDLGLCRLEVVDAREQTRFVFVPDGIGCGGVPNATLAPGDVAVVLYDVLAMPRLHWMGSRFWAPETWRPDSYELRAYLRMGKQVYREVFGPEIRIARRADGEMAALRERYGGGRWQRKAPLDWDWDQPTLALFGLTTFSVDASTRENLAALENTLSAGSLRHLVHVTLLTHAVYDAQELNRKRQATGQLLAWLDGQHEIARHWMAMRLHSWCWHNSGLGTFAYELVDEVIRRLPERLGADQDYQESARRHYLLDHPGADKYWKKPTVTKSIPNPQLPRPLASARTLPVSIPSLYTGLGNTIRLGRVRSE